MGGKVGKERGGTPLVSAIATVVVVILLAISGLTALARGGFTSLAGHTSPAHGAAPRAPSQARAVFAQQPCTPVYTQTNVGSTIITELIGGTDVTPLDQTSANGQTWQHVRIWSGVEGYIPANALGAQPPSPAQEGTCEYPGVPDPQSSPLASAHGPWPLAAQAVTTAPAALYQQPDGGSLPLGSLTVGAQLRITQWASDSAGKPWYQASANGITGWIWSGAVRVSAPDPATQRVNGRPIWQPMAGKGMWFTNYLTHHSDIASLVQAAKLAGVTHVYAEVAITQFGFYGQNALDRLLPVAHKAGLTVIAWVYPTLHDISTDVRLTQAVAAYTTPSGDKADGIATDVEEVDDSASVYTYGQLLRALLGPNALLVAAVIHPYNQTYYPYAAIATSWNVIAPMNYWHSRANHAYSQDAVRRFVTNSLITVQAAMGAGGDVTPLPIEELGQMYDMYTQDGTGAQDAPTGPEITADAQAARAAGCIGVSYFEWQTATQAEWQALSAYNWPTS